MAASRNRRPTDLLSRVGDFLAARVSADQTVSVGLSGGCDSVVLLHLLSRLNLGGRLSALHVHHGLSPNADYWATFCASYCADLGVPLAVFRVAVDADSGLGLEAAARQARYAVFSQEAGNCLLLGHHRGDQAETMLFNLLRGAGVNGAAGMRPERMLGEIRLLRPLLDTPRGEIEAYAREAGLNWIEDESNDNTRFSRNFLRHEVMHALVERFPAAEASLAQAANHFVEAAGLLDELADMDWQDVREGEVAVMMRLRAMSLSRLRNLLRYRLRTMGWRVPPTQRLEEFARQLQSAASDRHPELSLPDGRIWVVKGRLRWLAKK